MTSRIGSPDPVPVPAFVRWLRFFAGAGILAAIFAFFASGYTPPGAAGEVLRHNQTCDIDASPLFYTEVENMQELEEGLARMTGRRDKPDPGRGGEE